MNRVGNILLSNQILLESGTNEVEILVFRVGDYRLGINVAKVREVLPAQPITHVPQVHPSVIGMFRLRDEVVPCVSLHRHLGLAFPGGDQACPEQCNVILTEFNQMQEAFIVDSVERIHRLGWDRVLAVPPILEQVGAPVTAIVNLNGALVGILDFEQITAEISDRRHHEVVVSNSRNVPRNEVKVVIVDDSMTIRVAVETSLRNSGYEQVRAFENGQLAWDWLRTQFDATGDASQFVDVVITDAEMPQMDGFRLTHNIRQHSGLANLPVLLFSSIVTPENFKKGQSVGVDAQLAKPELARVIEQTDELVLNGRKGTAGGNRGAASSPEPAATSA